MSKSSTKIIIGTIIVVTVVTGSLFFYLNDTTTGSLQENNTSNPETSKVVSIQAQRTSLSFEQLTRFSDLIIVGTIVDNQLELVERVEKPNAINVGEGVDLKSLEYTITTPFQSITIEVEEYLKDTTGKYTDTFVFRDFASGIGQLDGENVFVDSKDEGHHQIGDHAIFFISDSMWGWVSFEWAQKFPIDENNKVQTPVFYSDREYGMPQDVGTAKTKIKGTLVAISEIKSLLETDDAKEKITLITQGLRDKGIPFKESSVKKSLEYRLLLKKMAGEEIVLDVSLLISEIESGVSMSKGDKEQFEKEFNPDVEIILESSTQ